jgi:hypothetical protein
MKKLQSICNKWAKRLRLQNWDIDFNVLSQKEYEDVESQLGITPGETEGCILPCSSRSCAQLNMVADSEDPETVIVHELIHLNQNGMAEVMQSIVEKINDRELSQHFAEQFIAAHEVSVHATARAFRELETEYESKLAKLIAKIPVIEKEKKPTEEPQKKLNIRKRHKKQPIGFHIEE